MEKIQKDYEELLGCFNKHRVKYCLVGAFAVAFHAIPRYTKDMDLFVEASPKSAKKIIAALRDFGFSLRGLSEEDFSQPGKTVQLGYEPVRVDLVTSIDGCDFDTVWKHRKAGSYGNQKVFFIGLEDLIKNKRASKRGQDQVDLETLKLFRAKMKHRSGK